MKIVNRLRRDNKGQVLILTLILLLIGSIMLPALLSYMTVGLKTGVVFENKLSEYYSADSGIVDARWQVKYDQLAVTVPSYNQYDYSDSYSYTAPAANSHQPAVTIKNIWIPEGLAAPTPSVASRVINGYLDTNHMIISGNVTGPNTYEIKLQYYQKTGVLHIKSIGVWFPAGYDYDSDSDHLQIGTNNITPTATPYEGGTAVVWNCNSYAFTDFPGSPSGSPMVSTFDFNFTGTADSSPSAVCWVNTDQDLSGGLSCNYTWDDNTKIFQADSTVGGTTIEALFAKNELRQLTSAIAGDYYATGQSLMQDTNNSPNYRELLLNSSSNEVSAIPTDAEIQSAYLYWSGYVHGAANGIWWDQCGFLTGPNDKWNQIGTWTVDSNGATGNTYYDKFKGQGNSSLTVNSSIDLSNLTNVSGLQSATISWAQNVSIASPLGTWSVMTNSPGNVTTGGALIYGGSNNIYALQGGTKNFWKYSISSNSWTAMSTTPANTAAGASLVYDGNNNIYAFQGGSTLFWKYSISGNTWTAMTAAPSNTAAGAALVYDGNNIYAFKGGSTIFWKYSISGNTWTAMTAAPSNTSTGAALVYAGTNIYAFQGGSTTFWKYSISGNAWTAMTAAPGAIAAGSGLTYDGTNIYALQGGSSVFWKYSISTNAWIVMPVSPGNPGAGAGLVYAGGNMYALRGASNNTFWRFSPAAIPMYLDISKDGGLTWTESIPVDTSLPSFSYTISTTSDPTYLAAQFKMRIRINLQSGDYIELDNILITDDNITSHYDPNVTFTIKKDTETVGHTETVTVLSNPGDFAWPAIGDDTSSEVLSGGTTFDGYYYACKSDVTNLVKNYSDGADLTSSPNIFGNGNGNYTVGDVYASTESVKSPGMLADSGYAGWSLVIIYTSSESKGHSLYIYDYGDSTDYTRSVPNQNPDGSAYVISIPVGGFMVPNKISGETDANDAAKITTFVGEGDIQLTGDYVSFTGQNQVTEKIWDGVTNDPNDTQSSPNNVWNSEWIDQSTGAICSIPGIDVDTFHIKWGDAVNGTKLINTGDTSATLTLSTHGDGYVLVYTILSFRSQVSAGGPITYLLSQH